MHRTPLWWRRSAATAETCGEAIDVPDSLPYPEVFFRVSFVGYVGRVERMSTPGAETAFWAPKL